MQKSFRARFKYTEITRLPCCLLWRSAPSVFGEPHQCYSSADQQDTDPTLECDAFFEKEYATQCAGGVAQGRDGHDKADIFK